MALFYLFFYFLFSYLPILFMFWKPQHFDCFSLVPPSNVSQHSARTRGARIARACSRRSRGPFVLERGGARFSLLAVCAASLRTVTRVKSYSCSLSNSASIRVCAPLSLSLPLPDKVIRHRASSLKDSAHAIFASELDPEFDRMCEDIKEARKKRGKTTAPHSPPHTPTPI